MIDSLNWHVLNTDPIEHMKKQDEISKRDRERMEELSWTPNHLLEETIKRLYPKDKFDFYYTTKFPYIKDCRDTDPIQAYEKGQLMAITGDTVDAPYEQFVDQMIKRYTT